jgi:DNA-directed RNA polymerase specialized sigma24 family protein
MDSDDREPFVCDLIAERSREDSDEEPSAGDEEVSPLARRIQEAIDGLPQTDRRIFLVVRLNEMTQTDAADVLGSAQRQSSGD